MKTLRVLPIVLSFSVSATVPAMAGVNVNSPSTGDQVSSPFKLSAWATSCSSHNVTAMGYSFDSSSDTTIIDGQSIDRSINGPSGHHTLHVKAWANAHTCVEDLDIDVRSGGSGGSPGIIIPADAVSVSHLEAMSGWSAQHDHGASGSASGSIELVSKSQRSNFSVSDESGRVLVINPGSTSTKFGIFSRAGAEWVESVQHDDAELEQFRGRSTLAQADFRAGLIAHALSAAGYDARHLAAVGGRGGFLPPLPCGTYLVDEAMVEELRLARRGEHACNLGAVLALRFAHAAG